MDRTHTKAGIRLGRRSFLQLGAGAAALPFFAVSSARSQTKFNWKFPTPVAADTPTYKAYKFLAERIEANTAGAVTVQIFPNGQFGGQPEAYKDVGSGRFQIAGVDASVTFADVPAATLMQLPYVYDSPESATKIWNDDKWVQPINDLYAARGYQVLAWFNLGIRQLGGTKPFAHPDDLKDVRIRILNSDLFITLFKTLGAVPVSLAPTEVYIGLQQGIVQAYDQPLSNIIGFKWYEAGKQITLSQHVYAASFLAVNKKIWETLPPPVQDGVQAAAKEFAPYNDKLMAQADTDAVKVLTDGGATVSIANLDEYRAKMDPVYAHFADTVGGLDKIKSFIAAQK